jgi:guanosine-3',5'-bis(diphosphate) 3'-pyrophosphohydrolase
MNTLSAIPIQEPWIDMILIGAKTWEIRTKNTLKIGPVALIRSGSKTVVATATLSEVVLITPKIARTNASLMGMTVGEALSCVGEFAWVLKDVNVLKKPVPYKHPSGAITWVTLDEATTGKVYAEVKHSKDEITHRKVSVEVKGTKDKDKANTRKFNPVAKSPKVTLPLIPIQTLYQEALKFAALKHSKSNQTLPGSNLPYVVHLSNVAMEVLIAARYTKKFNLGLALQVSLLHDTIEDTNTNADELSKHFGDAVADGVMALTKNKLLPKVQQMSDSLNRIKKQPKEIWAVKLSDRITNLQSPPSHWNYLKRQKYQDEAMIILDELKEGNEYLSKRLNEKIMEYNAYI